MKKYFIILMLVFLFFQIHSQDIYISSDDNKLYQLDLNACSVLLLTEIQSETTTDISFHPDGTLYGIDYSGSLYTIDSITGETNIVHLFDYNGSAEYNSLTIDKEGLVYVANTGGNLYSYDLINDTQVYIGSFGYTPSGDLIFYKDNLYLATRTNKIVQINLDDPPNSVVIIDQDISQLIFGLISFAEDCTEKTNYALSSSDDPSEIYEIDFNTNSLNFVCKLDIIVFGGASNFDFITSDPPLIEGIDITPPECGLNNGALNINASGGTGALEYSIDGVNFQMNNSFEDLAIGSYVVSVIDEDDCLVSNIIQINNLTEIVVSNIMISPTDCGENNGSIILEMEEPNDLFLFSINGEAFSSNFSFYDLPSGEYEIRIQDESNCQLDIQISIDQNDCNIYIPNVFSPNDDGFNDLFQIYPHPSFRGQFSSIRIFNRWGSLVYSLDNFEAEAVAWDGTMKGRPLQPDVFTYFIAYLSGRGEKVVLKGDISLIR
ncbi:MAG: gliding motility-associated C-terminal domain-containing protein [Saprospiraceae bacterium]|nr:gliding motility-associated C-terminal domain-containing protein [Saprospiraceae bacterium]